MAYQQLPLVKLGFEGDAARLIQLILMKIKLLNSANAKYDAATEAAVKQFQKTHQDRDGKLLKVDGEVGANTWYALMDVIK